MKASMYDGGEDLLQIKGGVYLEGSRKIQSEHGQNEEIGVCVWCGEWNRRGDTGSVDGLGQETGVSKMADLQGPEELEKGAAQLLGWRVQGGVGVCKPEGLCDRQEPMDAGRTWQPEPTLIG